MPDDHTEDLQINLTPQADMTVGTLTLTYANDVPTLTVRDGEAIPGTVTVVDESGQPLATYTAGEVSKARTLAAFPLYYRSAK